MKFIDEKINVSDINNIAITGLTDEVLSIFINKLLENNNSNDVVLVTNSLYEATKIYQSLQNYNDDTLFFPMDEFLMSEAVAVSPDLKTTRVDTLNKLVSKKKKKILITNLMGYLRYLPTKGTWKKNILNLSKNEEIKKKDIIDKLYNIGYNLETVVNKTGEVANRGYILDVFPINEENAVRIEFWGDNIESIRFFDVDTQLSLNEVNSITIYPFDEFICNDKNAIKKQKYLPLYGDVYSIVDFLDNPTLIYKDLSQIKNGYLNLREEINNYDLNKIDNIKTNYMHNFEDIESNKKIFVMNIDNILHDIKTEKNFSFNCKDAENYNGNFNKLNEDLKSLLAIKKTVVICLNSNRQIKNIVSYIENKTIVTNEKQIFEKSINIINKKITKGFIFENYVVLGESNLFNITDNKSVYRNRFRYGTKIGSINKLNIGDYVVHNTHGIGIYIGITSLVKNNIKKDYLQIKYRNNGKLYIPVEKIDFLTKFSSKEGIVPKLNKLGGTEWEKTKAKVRSKIQDIAQDLIKIYAQREAAKGYAFDKDTKEQLEFEKEFIYQETKDQLITTEQIKEDMEKDVPMDRLLCGDVGYGKTEVAFRIIFKAICNNKQVAYLCPTTLLSNQQYSNALERFKNFPINIALLNRFTNKKKVKEILEGLERNKIDVVFGTHRLLSNDVKFKKLGLLIIDEEQRFGVMHKEKIKQYKSNIDVLTLSATPIPRTLQMAMVGIRNLSLIETPPTNRYPVQTYVLEENEYIIKDAIYKEMSRDGQIFILYNRIDDIEEKMRTIKKMVPEAKITYAHGRMNKSEIEKVMTDFINKEYNVLVCTTIIETGIDIPNVNTLIVMNADKFGLSQLYQIRGRVGRSNKIAYAYLMYKKNKVLNTIAIKRLNAIKEFTELGSGFSIAVRDLSIRGAGDIIGSEQSGFIDTIGIELYTKILNEEVNKIRGILSEQNEKEEDQPLINVDTHIDDSYVDIDELKIEIHKKINEINSYEKLLNVKSELEDRFGKISESILIYMYEEWFEKLAKNKGVEKVNQNKNSVELIFDAEYSSKINIDDLFVKSYNISKMFRFSYSNKKIKIILDTIKLEKHWLYYFIDFLLLI